LFRMDAGHVEPRDEAGLGLDIDEGALAQWRVTP
jgi:hypothetical protein